MSAVAASPSHAEPMLLHTIAIAKGPAQTFLRSSIEYKTLDIPELSATITDLCNEPLFFSSYLSDEEDFSDDMSFSTGTSSIIREEDDFADDSETAYPELLAEECTFVEQQCSHARVISLVSAGRPKVVQVTKVDIPSTPSFSRPTSTASHFHKRNASSKSIYSLPMRTQHGRDVSNSSSSSFTPNLPSTPLLEQDIGTPTSARSPFTPKTPISAYRFDPLPSPTPSDESATPRTKEKSFRYFSHSRFSRPGISETRSFTMPNKAAPPIYPKPKMVARANSERSPILELPPFPADEVTQSIRPTRPWALRKDSFGPISRSQDASQPKQNRMRKVESVVGLNKR